MREKQVKKVENYEIYKKTERMFKRLRGKLFHVIGWDVFWIEPRYIEWAAIEYLGEENEALLNYRKALEEERNTRYERTVKQYDNTREGDTRCHASIDGTLDDGLWSPDLSYGTNSIRA